MFKSIELVKMSSGIWPRELCGIKGGAPSGTETEVDKKKKEAEIKRKIELAKMKIEEAA
jgi:hypothetical protein